MELDEEQHFNRYRSATLGMAWTSPLPWKRAYVKYCALHEASALRMSSGGGFWESAGSIVQFGPAGARRQLDGAGSPRWKQRALYDAMRDAVAITGRVRLARLSVYDELGGGVQLGAALCDLRRLDRGALADLIASRTVPSPSNEHRSLHLGRGASVAPVAERSASTATTYEPSQLAEQLGYAEVSRPGSAVRDYLRRTYPEHPNGERWALNEEQAADVLANVPRKR